MNPVPQRVLWITTDHMRFDCIGAYGNAAIHTPNLDYLAGHGVNFMGCYAQNPLCMPSRASFMTGLYPSQTGVTRNGHCLPPDFSPTVATAFKAGGYQTAQIGKLHFQPHENHDLGGVPRYTYGFDVAWISEEKGCYEDAYMTWLRLAHPELVQTFRLPRSTDSDRQFSEKQGVVLDAPWQASHAGWVSQMAQTYLGDWRSLRQFVHLGIYDPHPPLNPVREAFAPYEGAELPMPHRTEREWADKPQPMAGMLRHRQDWTEADFLHYRRFFYAMVTEADLAIGGLLAFLRRENLLDDTLIVFSSDHGDMCGDHSMTHKHASYHEEVMRLPLILHWPAGLGAQRRDENALIEMVDLLPTLLELSGANVPDVMAGRSYAADLLAGRPVAGREDVFACDGQTDSAMVRTDRYKYIRYGRSGGEVLWDLQDEPREVVNRAGDAQYAAVLHQMRDRLLGRLLEATRSPLPHLYHF